MVYLENLIGDVNLVFTSVAQIPEVNISMSQETLRPLHDAKYCKGLKWDAYGMWSITRAHRTEAQLNSYTRHALLAF